jgi:hypothetical protein
MSGWVPWVHTIFISLTHVIHLLDPVVARHRCKSLLANGGTIFITAPFRPKVGKWAGAPFRSDNNIPIIMCQPPIDY